tara:strand:- start:162 stop:866 length:705 start_codon:yes stop_codon:yes gene_type:complete
MSHWATRFYGNFSTLYGATKEDIKNVWEYEGRIQTLIKENKRNVYGDNKVRNSFGTFTDIPEPTTKCMCGHEIVDNCVVSNGVYMCIVGNCCANKFMNHVAKNLKERHKTKMTTRKNFRKWITVHKKNVKKLKNTPKHKCYNIDPIFMKKESTRQMRAHFKKQTIRHIKHNRLMKNNERKFEAYQLTNPTFGKYINIRWVDVPESYIKWCLDVGNDKCCPVYANIRLGKNTEFK